MVQINNTRELRTTTSTYYILGYIYASARREREAITIEKRRIQKEEAAKQKAEKAAANTLRQQKSNGIPHQTSPLDDTDTGNLMHIDSNDAVPSTSTSIASPSISSTTFTFKNQPYTYAFTHLPEKNNVLLKHSPPLSDNGDENASHNKRRKDNILDEPDTPTFGVYTTLFPSDRPPFSRTIP
ncbi:hypothetical protein RhiirA1_475761 [Rhizophagus irregularis]|uniref:Uncharacterized protein n=1 Tax=Rhizophagus irregularis TaxID=588596 RepID=A0A2N0QWA5_9GLOM|nr:hypothetical protein RhiirA1_475761 [Rhizophagus irregularis]CAG8724781.1 10645_t:CDS:2 [Rhizophagus irregularis]